MTSSDASLCTDLIDKQTIRCSNSVDTGTVWLSNQENQLVPRPISNKDIVDVKCGGHTMALKQNQKQTGWVFSMKIKVSPVSIVCLRMSSSKRLRLRGFT